MKRIMAMLLALLCLCPAACAEEAAALDETLEQIAREQAEKLETFSDNQQMLDSLIVNWHQCDEEERETFLQVDFTDPRKVDILIRPEEELELIQTLDVTGEERAFLAEHARESLCLMPIWLMRPFQSSMAWRMTCEELALQDAVILPELDGAAYVIQLYDPVDGVQPPMLVTAFVTTEHPATLVHTEFVWGNGGDVETLLYELISLLNVYTGQFDAEDVIIREYRPLPEVEATPDPDPTSVPAPQGALADWLRKGNAP